MRFAMPRPVPPGLLRRVPPAIFPPMLGTLGLVLAWRSAAGVFGLASGPIDAAAGGAAALAGFGLLAYAVKLSWRPAVLLDELTILPGRAGVGAGVLVVSMLAGVLAPYATRLAQAILVSGIFIHIVLLVALVRVYRDGPAERRRVTPVWHLNWAGFFVSARAAIEIGWTGLAPFLFWPALAAATFVWLVSARQLAAGRPPAPLRPMLAMHLAPVSLTAVDAAGLGHHRLALAAALAALVLLAALALTARWLLAAGFSPVWGALTFPLAATAGARIALARGGVPGARVIAAVILVAATLVILPILALILRDWARGRLPVKTNAAIA